MRASGAQKSLEQDKGLRRFERGASHRSIDTYRRYFVYFLNFTKVKLRQDTSAGPTHSFTDISLLGHDAGYVGALLVDPADPNVVYLGGSNRWRRAWRY